MRVFVPSECIIARYEANSPADQDVKLSKGWTDLIVFFFLILPGHCLTHSSIYLYSKTIVL